MLTHLFEEMVRRFTKKLGAILAKTGLSPNTTTIIGFLLNFPTAYLIAQGLAWTWLAGGVMVLVAGAFDMLDGAIAKATNRTTTFGAFLDSSLDRASELVVLFGVAGYYYGLPASQQMGGTLLAFAAAGGSMMVSYVKARAESLHIESRKVGLLQRPERVILVAIGCMLMPLWNMAMMITLGLIIVGTFITTGQRIGHAWRESSRQEQQKLVGAATNDKHEMAEPTVVELNKLKTR